ncbi:MAG: hypothetical protein PHV51_05975 [Methanosarcinaceae archaeon]|nr:hypothetical protein [Methanosarcinaceae archaeon]MDD4497682.1 hypothetical protein [Methanosarcinaceae archaeon]
MENNVKNRICLMLLICFSISTISGASAYEYSATTIEEYPALNDLDPGSK